MWRSSRMWVFLVAMTTLNVSWAEMENWQFDLHASGAWIQTRNVRIDDSGVLVTFEDGRSRSTRCASLSASDNAYFTEKIASIGAFMGDDRERIWAQTGITSEAIHVLTIAVSNGDGEISRYRFELDPIRKGDLDRDIWGGEAPPRSIAELIERAQYVSESALTPCTSEP